MNIDANTPERDVLIAYLEKSGVSQQKEAAKVIREQEKEIARLNRIFDQLLEELEKPSLISRIVLWFKGK